MSLKTVLLVLYARLSILDHVVNVS